MNHVDTIIKHADKRCKEHGARLTVKRKQLLTSLVMSNKALSAYELADVYKKNFGHNMPAMSIYRILEFLENENLVHKLSLVNKYVACTHISYSHTRCIPQFLICRNCSKVKEIDIKSKIINELSENINASGFNLLNRQLEMDCVCEACI
ncbi:MAG: transcriptional repressor [Porticoccus sp.]|nr:transcriptional repressor [Porticoccus sp.]